MIFTRNNIISSIFNDSILYSRIFGIRDRNKFENKCFLKTSNNIMDLLRDFCGSNGPKVFLYCGCTFLLTLIFAFALARQMDKEEDCFTEKTQKSLTEFNKEEVKEEFVNYEPSGPDILVVLRTDYKTALQLNEAGMIDRVIGYAPINFTIKTALQQQRRNSI
jgi:hypothetical protein